MNIDEINIKGINGYHSRKRIYNKSYNVADIDFRELISAF
ncbi:hypothetical protein psyc5s11_45720 [Clostridium gelidum]|uniref:Uncharacterized protein n=1 Tax=Clostridium gelidum TaxID=704125 RepID=A0ABN6J2H4_9CLOT|nr:hypothetical protein psyc5s11_45720 [Clostridium gelidum]